MSKTLSVFLCAPFNKKINRRMTVKILILAIKSNRSSKYFEYDKSKYDTLIWETDSTTTTMCRGGT